MAIQNPVATFTAEQGPKTVVFTTPAGNYAIAPGNPTVTTGSPPSSIWCESIITVGPATTVDVKSSSDWTGTVTVLVTDTP